MYADAQEAGPGVATGQIDVRFVDLAVEVFSMLANPTRVRIVLCLRAGELPVNANATAVGKAPTLQCWCGA